MDEALKATTHCPTVSPGDEVVTVPFPPVAVIEAHDTVPVGEMTCTAVPAPQV